MFHVSVVTGWVLVLASRCRGLEVATVNRSSGLSRSRHTHEQGYSLLSWQISTGFEADVSAASGDGARAATPRAASYHFMRSQRELPRKVLAIFGFATGLMLVLLMLASSVGKPWAPPLDSSKSFVKKGWSPFDAERCLDNAGISDRVNAVIKHDKHCAPAADASARLGGPRPAVAANDVRAAAEEEGTNREVYGPNVAKPAELRAEVAVVAGDASCGTQGRERPRQQRPSRAASRSNVSSSTGMDYKGPVFFSLSTDSDCDADDHHGADCVDLASCSNNGFGTDW